MSRVVPFLIAGVLPVSSGVAIAGGDARAPQSEVYLAGTWNLDAQASDEFAEVMAGRRAATRRGAGVARRGAAPGGGGARVMRREDVHGEMEALAKAPDRLIIEQSEGAVTLSFPDGAKVALEPAGERQDQTWFNGIDVEVSAEWKDGALRIERTLEHATAVDTYSRDPGADRLVVTTTVSGGMAGDVTLRRTYDLDPAS